MGRKPDFIRKKYGPLRAKTLRNALAHRIVKEFPRIGGTRICQLCADMILEVIYQQMRPKDHVKHGQLLWMAVRNWETITYRIRASGRGWIS